MKQSSVLCASVNPHCAKTMTIGFSNCFCDIPLILVYFNVVLVVCVYPITIHRLLQELPCMIMNGETVCAVLIVLCIMTYDVR